MPKSHYMRVAYFLKRSWPVIAGVLLLGHTAVLAESYTRVRKNGVVYYQFAIREQPKPNPAPPHLQSMYSTMVMHPGPGPLIQRVDQPYTLLPSLIKAVNKLDSSGNSAPASLQGGPELPQLKLKPANDPQADNSCDPQENIWTQPRYLGRLLGKFGFWSSPASVADHLGPRRIDRQQNSVPIQETRAVVQEVWGKFLQYTQAQPPKLLPGEPVVYRSAGSNQPDYCFPVAQPFSFRDSWGDSRSGGRIHRAVDIVAFEGTPVYAITGGVISKLSESSSGGITLFLRGQDGYSYGYMHLQGYAGGLAEGKAVRAGELIAYVGRTGVLRDAPHLHLQVHAAHRFERDELVNPYGLLVQLCNGKGVTDYAPHNLAHRRIPAVEIKNDGVARLSGSAPSRY